ncbi:MAG: hypothetical protein ACNA8W_22205 [Bradymonadaceae bacterium]
MILGAENITRIRRGETRGSDGRSVIAVLNSTTIQASVQPLTDRQREVLPEGIRTRVEKRLYSKSDFRTADQLTGTPSDYVLYNGETFEVVAVKRWPKLLAHYEVDLVRLTEEDGVWPPVPEEPEEP